MPPADPLTGDELIEVLQNGENRQTLVSALGVGGSTGALVLGSIQTGWISPALSSTGSTSAYATKGNIFEVSRTLKLAAIRMLLKPYGAGEKYKCVVYELIGNIITRVLYESEEFTSTTSGDADQWFVPQSMIRLEAGKRIAVVAVRTDGNATAICRVTFPGNAPPIRLVFRH